jgi:UDP-N-acetylmuramate--alanine ligase
LTRRVITYGFHEDADVRGLHATSDGTSSRCDVVYRVSGVPDGAGIGAITIGVPGHHNVQNALAAVAVGLEIGIPFARIQTALAEFRGAERRYQIRGTVQGVTVVDDYGHHPTEIAAVLRAARSGSPGRVVAVFQPHRFTRTRDLLNDFGPALALADEVVLTDIYPAGEAPIPGATLESLASAIRARVPGVHVVARLEDVPAAVAGMARRGDVVITLGAGSIAATADHLLTALQTTEVGS